MNSVDRKPSIKDPPFLWSPKNAQNSHSTLVSGGCLVGKGLLGTKHCFGIVIIVANSTNYYPETLIWDDMGLFVAIPLFEPLLGTNNPISVFRDSN